VYAGVLVWKDDVQMLNLTSGLRWEMPIFIPQTALIAGQKKGSGLGSKQTRSTGVLILLAAPIRHRLLINVQDGQSFRSPRLAMTVADSMIPEINAKCTLNGRQKD